MSFLTVLAQVCVKTTAFQATVDFYCDALGLKTLFNFTRGGNAIGFYLAASSSTFK